MKKRTKKILPHLPYYANALIDIYELYYGYSELMDRVCEEDQLLLKSLLLDLEGGPSVYKNITHFVMRDMEETNNARVPLISFVPEHNEMAKLKSDIWSITAGQLDERLCLLQGPVPKDLRMIRYAWLLLKAKLNHLIPKAPVAKKVRFWMFRERHDFDEVPRMRDLTRVYVEFAKMFLSCWYEEVEIRYICRGFSRYGEAKSDRFYDSDAGDPKNHKVYLKDELIEGDEKNLGIVNGDVVLFLGYGRQYLLSSLDKVEKTVGRISGYSDLYAYTEIDNGFHREMWQVHEELIEEGKDLIMTYMSEVEDAYFWMEPLAKRINKHLNISL